MIMAQYDTWGADWCLHKLSSVDICIEAMCWNMSIAMDGSQIYQAERPPNFCVLVVLFPGRMWPNVKYYGLLHDSPSLLLLNIHPSKVLQHFRSNGWLQLSHSQQVFQDDNGPESGVLVFFFASKGWWSWPSMTHEGQIDAFTNFHLLIYVLKQCVEICQ